MDRGVEVICWRGGRGGDGPPPMVRTAISIYDTYEAVWPWVAVRKALEPKSIIVVNKPLLLSATAVLVIGPAMRLPPLLVSNSVKTKSSVLLPRERWFMIMP